MSRTNNRRWGRAAVGGLLVLLAGCRAGQSAAPDPVAGLPRREGWTVGAEPVIQAGDFRPQALWADPCVLQEGGRYVMYLTSSTREPFKPPVLPFRAESDDGLTWRLNPATPLLEADGGEFVSLETPSVVYFKGQYHMYTSAIAPAGKVPMMAIGHAVSPDGVTWRRTPGAVLRATGTVTDWNGFLVGEPGAVVVDGRIRVYFSAVGARTGGQPPQLQTIGVAESDDGVRFGALRQAFGQSDLYPAGAGYVGYSTPAALWHEGRLHLFYDVAHFQQGRNPEWQQVALHHAVSTDGGRTFAQDAAPFLRRGELPWTTGQVLAPTVLVDGGRLRLWFGGHVRNPDLAPLIRRGFKGREFGIGHATAPQSWLQGP